MTKRVYYFVIIFFGIMSLLLGCEDANKQHAENSLIIEPKDLDKEGYIIGVPKDFIALSVAKRYFDKAEIKIFDNVHNGYTAVQQKTIDAFIFDRHNLSYVSRVKPELIMLPWDLAGEHIVVGLPKKNTELKDKVNEFIAQYRTDGTYPDMYERWFSANPPKIQDIPVPANPSLKLKLGTEGLNEPMNYYDNNGQLTGFDIEFIRRLGKFLNADIEIIAMPFSNLIVEIEEGNIDAMIANLNATDEYRQKILFSNDYLNSTIGAIVHKDRVQNSTNNNS